MMVAKYFNVILTFRLIFTKYLYLFFLLFPFKNKICFGRYHLVYQSSRSVLVDMLGSPTNYRLFMQGIERQRLEYAILLLNNCIKQVCVKRGVLDVKADHNPVQVLKNLKLLMDKELPPLE